MKKIPGQARNDYDNNPEGLDYGMTVIMIIFV